MADVQQVYTIVNAIMRQGFGETAVEVVDLAGFISTGNDVLSTQENKDIFTGALSDVIGRTIISIRAYNPSYEYIVRNTFDYGMALRKIYVDVGDAMENPSWEIGEESYQPDFAPVYTPEVKEYLFAKRSTYEFGVTIPDYQLETAFHNPMEMALLIDGIFVAMDNRFKASLESMISLTMAAFIARKMSEKKGMYGVNLLSIYNAATGNSLTQDQARITPDFYRYSNAQISLFCDRFERMSRIFNNAGNLRHTPEDLQVLLVLSDYAKASQSYLQSDTFHDEYVEMPYYRTVPYWQGSGENYDFSSVSAIDVQIGNTEYKMDGIVALLYDHEALGITFDRERMATQRNGHAEYTDYWHKADRGYFNDMSENGIVFYMADTDGITESEVVSTAAVKKAVIKK